MVNANDSFWLPNPAQPLEGYAGIIGCERCERSLRQRMVYRYVIDRLAGSDGLARNRRVSHRTLKLFEHENRVFGAELAREDDDLLDVCRAADGGASCDVLAAWDGRSDIDSVGTQVFQEFWKRASDATVLWETPFDPAQPVTTPRNLAETSPGPGDARRARLLAERASTPRLPGRLQVAGDEGAPPIAVEAVRASPATPTRWRPGPRRATRAGSTRSATAPRTSRRSPSRTVAGSPRTRS